MYPLLRHRESVIPIENGITDKVSVKTYGIIVLDLSVTQNMSIVLRGTVQLGCKFAELLGVGIVLI